MVRDHVFFSESAPAKWNSMANKMKLIAEKYHKLGLILYNVEWEIPRIIPISINTVAMIENTQAKGLKTFLMVFGFFV